MDIDSKPIVSLEGVSFSYNSQPVLQEINLSLFPGKFIGIIPNGQEDYHVN